MQSQGEYPNRQHQRSELKPGRSRFDAQTQPAAPIGLSYVSLLLTHIFVPKDLRHYTSNNYILDNIIAITNIPIVLHNLVITGHQ